MNIHSNRKQRTMKSSKQVRFADMSQMVVVVNLTEKYKQEVWYTKAEMKSFKINTRRLAGDMLMNKELHVIEKNIVGLEKYLSIELFDEFILRREQLMNEVLGEAQRQKLYGLDYNRLARSSEKCTVWARERARASALVLEFEQLITTQM